MAAKLEKPSLRDLKRRTKPRQASLRLERFVLKDKDTPLFRARRPDQYILQIMVENVIVREFSFYSKKDWLQHWTSLMSILALSEG